MPRSTVQIVAVFVLVLLGAPVAMHVVLHDLHDHHDERATAYTPERGHADHEHPIVSASAPQLPGMTRIALAIAAAPVTLPGRWTWLARGERNVIAFGALRTDTDVGLQPLLATFLI